MAKPRTSASTTGEDAGYRLARPPPIVQPPAVVTCPWRLMTSSSHVVPAGMPLTCTLSCSPHTLAAYLTVAVTPVRGLAARDGTAQAGAEAAARLAAGDRAGQPGAP